MKKFIIAIAAVLGVFSATSCSDMIEVESTNQVFNPALDNKTDSLFYAFGIMQAMQQLADQYVFQGEMRGDNVATTTYTNTNLRQLANFTATAANKYDSAYVYYRVINNCNYYIAHRDTTLLTGSTNVVRNEYAAVKAFRAWAYLQLARNYGRVPFFTEPLTSISQINNSNFPELDINGITAQLAPDLQQYSGLNVPHDGSANFSAGSTNWGQSKTVYRALCFIPVDVILGELYLEAGDYANAAKYYTVYLTQTPMPAVLSRYAANRSQSLLSANLPDGVMLPSDMAGMTMAGQNWNSTFTANNPTEDIISYIPMAVNYQRGTTTQVPLTFGFNYYSTEKGASNLYVDEVQLLPSKQLQTLSDTATYYYYRQVTGGLPQQYVNGFKAGDLRLNSILRKEVENDSTKVWIRKYESGNIILFRNTTVYLHLAEALNRLGYPDAAFAILKDGINQNIADSTCTYVSDASKTLLSTTYPFLGTAYGSLFPKQATGAAAGATNWGVHQHGAGVTADGNYPNRVGSPMSYNYATEMGNKLAYLRGKYGEQIGATKADSINAMEDLLCDEYQLEFAFEGTRWYDLMRLARHKNQAGTYGSNFGSQWLSDKLSYKNPQVDLTNEQNWYLPFK